MENEIKVCVDCGEDFEITEGWKKLLAEHPDWNPPTRCYDCRQKRKEERGKDNSKDNKRDNHRRERW